MTSNPIVIHSSVVFLRLYWFEKRFQNMVRDARARRVTISKSRAKAHLDMNQAEMGVAGRNIRIMPNSGSRITNDGIILDKKVENGGHESPSSNHTAVPSSPDTDDSRRSGANGHSERPSSGDTAARSSYTPRTARSDDIELDSIHGPRRLSHAEHLAILERQRRGHDETLRIPNPRDVEKGIKPKRVEEGDAPEAEEEEDPNQPGIRSPGNTRPNTPPEGVNPRNRQPTIKIFEPQKPSERRQRPTQQDEESPERDTMDELAEEATVIGNVLDSVMFRKPRIFQRGQKKYHVDSDEDENDGPRPGPKHRTRTLDVLRGALTGEKADDAPYLSWTPTLGRNSQFPGLSLEQREELGGIEYRSLRTLALLLVCYFWGWSIFALVCLLPWIKSPANNEYAQVVDAAGMSRTWWGFFTANSAFLDLGLTLTPDSMVSFNQSQYVLMIMVFLIIIGNTGFPVMLRSIIWVMARLVPRGSGLWEELRFLLDHPRRCFTLLFPASATWWLFWILIGLNAIDLLFFVLLDLNDNVVSDMPVHLRIFTTGGKLVIIAMQIRGRHRGLPYGLDRAVLLPSEARFADEAFETQNGLTRQMTAVTNRTGADLQRGRSRDRGIFSSFLHPGPAVPREDRNLARRVSFDAGVSASGANGMEGLDLRRRHTVAVEDADTDEDEEIAPATRARRVFTTPMG
ncbi:High-affinity potassium transport protein like [Verticillium longisporum]|uniref:High-affinity potassium transport protein like n=1 Tax=Verticillium longisporum TaxID=100787 RepID=A0A8I3AIW0_VERLO|nr:High-affinity potassium transport protein like [Verticillium longisporum]